MCMVWMYYCWFCGSVCQPLCLYICVCITRESFSMLMFSLMVHTWSHAHRQHAPSGNYNELINFNMFMRTLILIIVSIMRLLYLYKCHNVIIVFNARTLCHSIKWGWHVNPMTYLSPRLFVLRVLTNHTIGQIWCMAYFYHSQYSLSIYRNIIRFLLTNTIHS